MPIRLVLVLAMVFVAFGCSERRDDDDKPKAPHASQQSQERRNTEPGVTLAPDGQARIGLEVQTLQQGTAGPEVVAFGQLEEDSGSSFVVRAPFAGTLRPASRAWPRLGEALTSGTVVASIEPRLAPAEQVNATMQLATARADRDASVSALTTARAAYERAHLLNADAKNVSDRAVEEAAARVAAEEARVKTATDTVQLLETALGRGAPGAETPIAVERGGTVVELLARPGESVEPGAPVLRVSDFDHLLARVDLPVGESLPREATHARIFAVGFENRPLEAERVGVSVPTAGSVAPQGQSFVFRTRTTEFGIRPGLAVTARIAVPGEVQTGVVLPATAVVRAAGQTFAYVQTSETRFTRKAVTLGAPTGSGYLISAGFSPADRVVVQGAQLLLSEELKAQLQSDDDDQD
jgi:hypothetical protein